MKRVVSLCLALCLSFCLSLPALAEGFSDVPESHVFYQAIQDCAGKGILSGYSDGTFHPSDSVTRAQFCVMLVRAFYPQELSRYESQKSIGWYGPSAALLKDKGILFYGDEHWKDPEVMKQSITRRDMAQFLGNLLKAKGYSVSEADRTAARAQISDFALIGEYYENAVASVYALGIITGYHDNSFGPSGVMTRGQGAVVIYRTAQCMSTGTLKPVQEKPAANPDTLVNGKAVTEENVVEFLQEMQKAYPEGTDFSAGYPDGDSSPVRSATYIYERAENPKTHTSNIEGCGGWTTLLSDGMFSQKGFEMRKTTLEEARPGDVMIQLDGNGRLVHVAMISRSPVTKDGRVSFAVTEAGTDQQGIYRVHWDVDYSWSANSRYTYDIWTRYPA